MNLYGYLHLFGVIIYNCFFVVVVLLLDAHSHKNNDMHNILCNFFYTNTLMSFPTPECSVILNSFLFCLLDLLWLTFELDDFAIT